MSSTVRKISLPVVVGSFVGVNTKNVTNGVTSKEDGDDRLEGGESSDKIFGGLGSDFIDGGEGEDIAFYAGNFEDYEFDRRDTISSKRKSDSTT